DAGQVRPRQGTPEAGRRSAARRIGRPLRPPRSTAGRPARPRRRPRAAGGRLPPLRRTGEPPLLRRADPRAGRLGARNLPFDGRSRLAVCPGLAAPGPRRGLTGPKKTGNRDVPPRPTGHWMRAFTRCSMADISPHLMTLFTGALERPPGPERASYLDGACGGDAALRAEVEALLAVSARAGGVLAGAVEEAGRSVDLPRAAEAPGMVVGPYKLVEQIGEGGMGSVWMAQQTEPVKRLVAVKLIKPGMDSKQVLARFEAERQALALMDHPNIA